MIGGRAKGRLTATLLCAAATVAAGGGCSSSSPSGIPPGARVVPAGQVDTLADEVASGITDARREVVRSDSAWVRLWEEIYAGRTPRPAVPGVDFERRMVIAVAMGRRPTGGFAIGVEKVYGTDDSLHVVVLETSPGPSCGTTQALTQPVMAVGVPASGADVRFHETSVVTDCS